MKFRRGILYYQIYRRFSPENLESNISESGFQVPGLLRIRAAVGYTTPCARVKAAPGESVVRHPEKEKPLVGLRPLQIVAEEEPGGSEQELNAACDCMSPSLLSSCIRTGLLTGSAQCLHVAPLNVFTSHPEIPLHCVWGTAFLKSDFTCENTFVISRRPCSILVSKMVPGGRGHG